MIGTIGGIGMIRGIGMIGTIGMIGGIGMRFLQIYINTTLSSETKR